MKNFLGTLITCEQLFTLIIILSLTFVGSEVMGEIAFEETTISSGISIVNQTYGSAWVDFNEDDWPDLWSGNHFNPSKLYLNNQDGTFTEFSSQVGLDSLSGKDLHGSSWIDFDNDGDNDLFVTVGAEGGQGKGPNLLFVNEESFMQERASELGLDFPLGRARTPIWFDWDNDGLLDVIISNLPRPDGQATTSLFHQTSNGFENISPKDGFKMIYKFGSILVPSPNNTTHIFYITSYNEGIYNLSNFPNQTLKEPLSVRRPPSVDLAFGDFNGDLLLDIFQTKNQIDTYVFIEDSKNIFARLLLRNAGEQGILFQTGTFLFNSFTRLSDLNLTDIYIGSKGYHPDSSSFSLSSSERKVWGISKHIPGVDRGLYIGYDPNIRQWEIQHSSDVRSKIEFEIISQNSIFEITHKGTESDTIYLSSQLLIQAKSWFRDRTTHFGVDTPVSCGSVGTGDFDNDMDLDIYLVCSLSTKNLPNILYENIGNRKFVAVDNSGGATGTNLGVGGAVSIADYDRDGFLDLFVTNGAHGGAFKNGGPSQLFKNIGNENHWLEIDLEGTISNRDGIGSRVYITANGVTQVREQSGGIHYRSQDYQSLHVGLGQNALVESVVVHWPSGIIQEKKNILADQIITIVEQAPIDSLKYQISKGIEPEDIKCRNDLVLILKASTNELACIKSTSVNKLIDRSWGIPIN